MDYFVVIILVCFSAMFSGLTLGFFSLNRNDLKRKAKLGDKKAKKVYRLRKDGNLLLCTLLVGNVAVNTILSVFLGQLFASAIAVIFATGLIVIFGEILPQATFTRYALTFGAKLTLLVRVFIIIFWPVCWPIARALDKMLGDELPTIYTKQELAKIIEEHENLKDSDVDTDEERIVKGALSYSDKTVRKVLTPRNAMFTLPYDQVINRDTIAQIRKTGHSRIPIYKKSRDNIVAILYVKDLVGRKWQGKTIGEMARKEVIFVDSSKTLDNLLNNFKRKKNHMFVVQNEFGVISGIVTIEDVIEEIIGFEIVDEFDKYANLQELAKQKTRELKRKKV